MLHDGIHINEGEKEIHYFSLDDTYAKGAAVYQQRWDGERGVLGECPGAADRLRGEVSAEAWREAVGAILLGAAMFFPAGMYEAIWARFMEDLGASTLFVGISLTMYGIPFAFTANTAGKLIDRIGPWRAAGFGISVIIPMTFFYGFLTSPWLLMGLAMVEAVGQGVGSNHALTSRAFALICCLDHGCLTCRRTNSLPYRFNHGQTHQ